MWLEDRKIFIEVFGFFRGKWDYFDIGGSIFLSKCGIIVLNLKRI